MPHRCTMFAVLADFATHCFLLTYLFATICLKIYPNTLAHESAITTPTYICMYQLQFSQPRRSYCSKFFVFFFWSPSFEMRLTANKFRHFAELVRMRQCARLCNMRRKNVCFLYIYATLAAAKFYFCTQKCCVLSHSCHCCCYRCCCC